MSPSDYWEAVPKGFKGTRLQYFVFKKQEEMIDKLRKSGELNKMSLREKIMLNNTDLKSTAATKFLKKKAIQDSIEIHCRKEHRHEGSRKKSPYTSQT